MVKNRGIEAGAKAIASDLMLPGGRQKKLSRVIEDHLAWFDAAEARGMTWEDMVAVLSTAGATGRGGRPLTVGTLSSAVWRKRNQSQSPIAEGPISEPQPVIPAAKKSPAHPERSRLQRPKEALEAPARSHARPANSGQGAAKATSPGSDVLAFMQRAAKMRRDSDD